ncbi:MAG: serpin family protein [bacterium]
MTRKSIWLLFLLICLPLTACEQNATDPVPRDETRALTTDEKDLVASGNAFGHSLFKAIATSQPDSNLFISPLSVSMALGMALNGAAGATYQEMQSTLELHGLTQEQINSAFHDLIELLIRLDPEVVVKIANSIWIREHYPVLPEFIQVNQTYFDAATQELDFSLPEAVNIINGWIEDNTNGLIVDALDRIDPLAVLYLINTIYFKGTWTTQFDPEHTFDTWFTNINGSMTPCRMMNLETDLNYFECDDFQAVDLPYGNGKFSMTILLPVGDNTVADIVAQLDSETWDDWMGRFEKTELIVGLPRFKLEYGLLLNDALAALGMPSAFTAGADFSRIVAERELFINRVIHKTFVEVDEEGTEAAAVTIVEFRETAIGTAMCMNRPFVFVIRENHSGSLLFMGALVDFPTE